MKHTIKILYGLVLTLCCACAQINSPEVLRIAYLPQPSDDGGAFDQSGVNGARLAAAQAGTRDGKKFEIVVFDRPASAGEQTLESFLKQSGTCAVIASSDYQELPALAVLALHEEMVVISGSDQETLPMGDYLFRSVSDKRQIFRDLAQYCQAKHFRRIAVLTGPNAENVSCGTVFAREAEAQRIPEIQLKSIVDNGQLLEQHLGEIDLNSQDAIVLWLNGRNLGYVTRSLRHLGYLGPIIGPSEFSSRAILGESGPALNNTFFAAQYLMPSSPETAENASVNSFLRDYTQQYGEMPSSTEAFSAYDGACLLIAALRETHGKGGRPLRDALWQFKSFKGLAGIYDYSNRTGEGIAKLRVYTIQDRRVMLAR